MCHSRGAHIVCTCTYSGQGARKKIRPRMCTYGRGLECLLAHTYVRPGLVYMAGSERRNNVVVVFMGRQRNASCSWGGNRMHRVHGEATKCVVFIRRQWNAWEPTSWVRTECVVVFIGRAWTEQAMETRLGVPQNGGNGLVFDRPRSKYDPVHQEGSGVPQNGGNGPPMVETGVLLIGREIGRAHV